MAIGAYPERKVPWPNDCIICQLQVYIVLVLSQNWGNTPCLAFRLWTWGIWWPTMSLGYPLFRQTDGIEQSPNSDWWIIIEAIHISSIYYVYIYVTLFVEDCDCDLCGTLNQLLKGMAGPVLNTAYMELSYQMGFTCFTVKSKSLMARFHVGLCNLATTIFSWSGILVSSHFFCLLYFESQFWFNLHVGWFNFHIWRLMQPLLPKLYCVNVAIPALQVPYF